MSNVNAPNGFTYFGRQDGGSPTMGNTTRKILSTYNVAIGYGDPVISVSSGYIQQATASTVQIAGIFYGCSYLNTSVGRRVWANNWPGTTQGSDAIAYLNTDPASLFLVQSLSTAVVFADIEANINFAIGTVNTVTGLSATTIDQSTIATTNTLPFRVVGLYSQYEGTSGTVNGTDDASNYNRIIVAPNFWDRSSATGIV